MKTAANALQSIIDDEFDGRKKNLALKSKLPANYITRLTQNQTFTPQTLEAICKCLKQTSAEKLCLAVAQDILPANFNLSVNHKTTDPFDGLDKKTQQIICNLAERCARDEDTKKWLHQLSKLMFEK